VWLERDDGLVLTDDRARLDRYRITTWLAGSYWASDRTPEQVERSLANSLPYGVYTPDGEQVALTRVTTDLASFAWIGDVYVDENWRGRGIGTWVVGSVVEELTRLGVPRFVLATRDAHGVYSRLGFEPLRVPEIWMEIDLRPNRPTPGSVSPPQR
jgi:GNAT superfamily N-acetyltransferase